jgi:hypothetical protein
VTATEATYLPACPTCAQPRYRFAACECTHAVYLHEFGKRAGATVRTACSHYSAEVGYCPCRMFAEVPDGR